MRLDDDTYLDASPSLSIGEIKLDIFRTTAPKVVAKENLKKRAYFSLPPLQKVHERSKKAIAHRVKYVTSLSPCITLHILMLVSSYGSKIPYLQNAMYSVTSVERLVTFIFKYRPLGM